MVCLRWRGVDRTRPGKGVAFRPERVPVRAVADVCVCVGHGARVDSVPQCRDMRRRRGTVHARLQGGAAQTIGAQVGNIRERQEEGDEVAAYRFRS